METASDGITPKPPSHAVGESGDGDPPLPHRLLTPLSRPLSGGKRVAAPRTSHGEVTKIHRTAIAGTSPLHIGETRLSGDSHTNPDPGSRPPLPPLPWPPRSSTPAPKRPPRCRRLTLTHLTPPSPSETVPEIAKPRPPARTPLVGSPSRKPRAPR